MLKQIVILPLLVLLFSSPLWAQGKKLEASDIIYQSSFSKKNFPKDNQGEYYNCVALEVLLNVPNAEFIGDDILQPYTQTITGGYRVFLKIPKKDVTRKFYIRTNEYQELAVVYHPKQIFNSFELYKIFVTPVEQNTAVDVSANVLKWLEQLRQAYEAKDIQYFKKAYNKEALLLTGSQLYKHDYVFRKQTKEEYIARLKSIFNRYSRIRVSYDQVKIEPDNTRAGWFGITLTEGLTAGNDKSQNYYSEGYIFMLTNFEDEAHPQILVRVWEDVNEVNAEDRITLTKYKSSMLYP